MRSDGVPVPGPSCPAAPPGGGPPAGLPDPPPRVSAVVPAYNEAGRVAATVRALLNHRVADEVWVVDDGSTDGTAEVAAAAGARVLRLPRRSGKGRALLAGARCARAGVLLFADADLGESAAGLARLVAPVLGGEADMCIAAPPPRPGRNGLGVAVGVARWGVQRLTGRRFSAPLSGQRALSRRVLGALADTFRPAPAGWGIEVALTVAALRAGLRVAELPLDIAHRVTRLDWHGFRHRGTQLAHIAVTLARCWALPAPAGRQGTAIRW
ncbi:MAG TPA: glycosyltransferase family 2 protein [Thermaerobacter sp.]